MTFTSRATSSSDLERALPLIADRHLYPSERDREDLLALWQHVLDEGSAVSMVVEDAGWPTDHGLVAFGMSLFVSDGFAAALESDGPVHVAVRALGEWRRGNRVFLSPLEIARHQDGDGLNVAVMHYGCRPPAPREMPAVASKLMDAFFWSHGGYRVKAFYEAVYGGPADLAIRLANGLRLCREHRDLAGADPVYLVTARPADLPTANLNLAISKLFRAPRPRFGLTMLQRATLWRALTGDTDQEMAHSLGVSLWTIKKRWQAIYQKVDAADPSILAAGGTDPPGGTGPPRQRRRLLAYLRQHLEEVRPHAAPPREPPRHR